MSTNEYEKQRKQPPERTHSPGGIFLTAADLYDKNLTGGQRSRLNIELLARVRGLGVFKGPTTETITNLRWLSGMGLTIERVFQSVWHAGHVNAILASDPVAIVAAETGGVWLVNHYPGAIPIVASHPATPLSNDWDDPDVNCLAYAPGSTSQFYAGCNGGSLFLVELQPVLGGMDRKSSASIPVPGIGSIRQIVIMEGPRRIVVSTSSGVWWSNIPSVPGDASGYSWQGSTGLPFGTFSGLAEGPNQSIIVSASGSDVTTGLYGIFRGQWQNGNLVFMRSTIAGVDQTKMLRTSMTSCAANRSVAYCAAAAADESLLAVLASRDGGVSWNGVATPGPTLTGFQGSYNNVIAVSPFRSNVVVLGWRAGGPFFSTDSGANWARPHNDNDDLNLHGDLHALCFGKNGANADWVFAGSDGGVVNTRDLGQSWDSQYNKQVQNLQFYGNALHASSRFVGLIAGGTQDNGNIFCNTKSEFARWHTLEGGDGGGNRFIDPLGALLRFNNTLLVNNVEVGNRVRMDFWNASTESFGGLGQVVPVDGDAGGLVTPFLEVVLHPTWRRGGKLMYAVAAAMGAGQVYGFFANSDGSGATFLLLADVGDKIAGVASRDGNTVLVGTQTGRILSLNSGTGASGDMTLPEAYRSGSYGLLADLEVRRAFALHSSGRLLRYDGTAWQETSGAVMSVFEADPSPGSHRVFAANDTSVTLSMDDGVTWADASLGLPARAHCNNLRLVPDGAGGHDLYLGTYGRSVWKAKADYVDKGPDLQDVPGLVAEVLFGVLGDGGGVIRIGKTLIRVPPREPVRNIFAAIVIDEFARSMSPEVGRGIQIAALKAIQQIAEAQLRQLQGSH